MIFKGVVVVVVVVVVVAFGVVAVAGVDFIVGCLAAGSGAALGLRL